STAGAASTAPRPTAGAASTAPRAEATGPRGRPPPLCPQPQRQAPPPPPPTPRRPPHRAGGAPHRLSGLPRPFEPERKLKATLPAAAELDDVAGCHRAPQQLLAGLKRRAD